MPMAKTPKKPGNEGADRTWITRSVRLPKDLLDWLEQEADEALRSANLQLVHFLQEIKKHGTPRAPEDEDSQAG